MGKLTKDELQVRNREIQDRMSELNEKVVTEKRENFNEEEQREWNNLSREYELNEMKMQSMMTDEELAKHREIVSKGEQLREYFKQVRQGKADREILLFPAQEGDTNNITASGAIQLSIHEMIPTLHEGLGLPASLRIVTGVTGNEIWPVSINDAEMEEVGEVEALNDQVLDFANITPTQRRVGLTIPESINGHEYVDLGLSVKWATTNIGASSPSEYGSYFAWGEIKTKDKYTWENYKFYVSGDYDEKTVILSKYNDEDNKSRLDLSDDAARVNWGGTWRLPTKAETDELRHKCSWEWTTIDGKDGYKVTSKSNGNSIFLPASGDWNQTNIESRGTQGGYATSSLVMDNDIPYAAHGLGFFSSVVPAFVFIRYFGLTVRPVSD